MKEKEDYITEMAQEMERMTEESELNQMAKTYKVPSDDSIVEEPIKTTTIGTFLTRT